MCAYFQLTAAYTHAIVAKRKYGMLTHAVLSFELACFLIILHVCRNQLVVKHTTFIP